MAILIWGLGSKLSRGALTAGCFSSTELGRGREPPSKCISLLFPCSVQWHALGREEQAKYYELARRERQLHMQLYPDWSSRANTQRGKKRKRKQETTDGGTALQRPLPTLRPISLSLRFGPPLLKRDCATIQLYTTSRIQYAYNIQ